MELPLNMTDIGDSPPTIPISSADKMELDQTMLREFRDCFTTSKSAQVCSLFDINKFDLTFFLLFLGVKLIQPSAMKYGINAATMSQDVSKSISIEFLIE